MGTYAPDLPHITNEQHDTQNASTKIITMNYIVGKAQNRLGSCGT